MLPGVRSASDPLPWPAVLNGRPAPSSSANNGGDYVASRRALLSRYATPWLLALHNQDADKYCTLLYDICVDLTEDVIDLPTDIFAEDPKHDAKVRKVSRSQFTWSHLILHRFMPCNTTTNFCDR